MLTMGIWELIRSFIQDAASDAASSYLNNAASWLYNTVCGVFYKWLSGFNNYALELFELSWVEVVIEFFRFFGFTLFVIGMFVASAECAIEYQEGRGGVKSTALNIFKGFCAAYLFSWLPVELYKFCVSSQNMMAAEITGVRSETVGVENLIDSAFSSIAIFSGTPNQDDINSSILVTIEIIAFIVVLIKIFLANVKRGGILLTQIAVGSLYMFSIPRGYSDGFWNWCKQIIGTCFTAFMQMTLLYLGLLTVSVNPILGIGVMLAASEVPRIAQHFGLDTSIKGNMTSAIYATSSAVNLTRTLKTIVAK